MNNQKKYVKFLIVALFFSIFNFSNAQETSQKLHEIAAVTTYNSMTVLIYQGEKNLSRSVNINAEGDIKIRLVKQRNIVDADDGYIFRIDTAEIFSKLTVQEANKLKQSFINAHIETLTENKVSDESWTSLNVGVGDHVYSFKYSLGQYDPVRERVAPLLEVFVKVLARLEVESNR